jgi:hypothetical protein
MNIEFIRNLRLAISISLVCLWCFATLERIPYFGGSLFLLLVAAVIPWPGRYWAQGLEWKRSEIFIALMVLVALVTCAFLFSLAISEKNFEMVWHSPLFVFLVWVYFTWSLVHQTTRLSRFAPNYSSKPTC